MMIHDLKTLAPYWDAIYLGEKTFELRKDDRNYRVGELLNLLRYGYGQSTGQLEPEPLMLPGPDNSSRSVGALLVLVTFKLTFTDMLNMTGSNLPGGVGLSPGWCILGVRKL